MYALTEDEERALILRARDAAADPGDRLTARNALVVANKGLAVSVARRFRGCRLNFDDMVQLGFVGLIKAADRFDPARLNRFKSYAGFWIRREIMLAVRRHRAAVTTYDPAEAYEPAAPQPDPPAYLPDEIAAVAEAAQGAGLSDRERRFLECRFGSYDTREEVARKLGISREGARLIENRVLDKLKAAMGQPVPVRVKRRDRGRKASAAARRSGVPPGPGV